jgi:hypothetical protein
MNPMADGQLNHFAFCADKAIEIGLAVGMIIFGPSVIRQKIKDGKITGKKGSYCRCWFGLWPV